MAGDPQALKAGDHLADFAILEPIGEGGMGFVYLARDERLHRQVALKVIAPRLAHDPDFQERFELEARSAAAIDHPNVVSVYSAGSADGQLFIAMRHVNGTDLGAVLRDEGRLAPDVAVAVLGDVAAALDAAHAAGLVHRDVKPANILISGPPGEGMAHLTDFGLTKGLQGTTQLTGTGQWIGTVDYVAPEQMTTGRVDARTDVYALGCVLFEILTGAPPFSGSEMQKMWRHVNEPVPSLGADLGSLDPVIARATAKEPEDRYPSAGDFAIAARAAIEGIELEGREHSVARGPAASGLPVAGFEERTRPLPRISAAEVRTTPMASPTTDPRNRNQNRRLTGRTSLIIGASVVFAAALIAAALVFSGGKSEPAGSTVINNIEKSVGAASAAQSSGSERASEEAASISSSSLEGEEDLGTPEEFTRFSQSLYSIEVPAGWVQEASDEPTSTYYESTWRNPTDENTSILVDAQVPAPEVSPLVSAEEVRAQTSQSSDYREISFESTVIAGMPAARWVFEVSGDRRVDYFVNVCNVGLAVLGSTYPSSFRSYASTFHRAASSVAAVYCE